METIKAVDPISVHWMDAEELAAHILGLDYDQVESDEIEEKIFDKFECSMETFQVIVSHLLPLVDVGKSPLTGEVYKGFSKSISEDGKDKVWIVRDK